MSACTCVFCTHAAAIEEFHKEVEPARSSQKVADEVSVVAELSRPELIAIKDGIFGDAVVSLGLYGHLLPLKALAPLRMLLAVTTAQGMLAEEMMKAMKSAKNNEGASNVH